MQRIFQNHIEEIICGSKLPLAAIPVANALLECEYRGRLMNKLYKCVQLPEAEPELAMMIDKCLQTLNIKDSIKRISEKIRAVIISMEDDIDVDGANKMANLFIKTVGGKKARTFLLLASKNLIVRAIVYLRQRTHNQSHRSAKPKYPDARANLVAEIEKCVKERSST